MLFPWKILLSTTFHHINWTIFFQDSPLSLLFPAGLILLQVRWPQGQNCSFLLCEISLLLDMGKACFQTFIPRFPSRLPNFINILSVIPLFQRATAHPVCRVTTCFLVWCFLVFLISMEKENISRDNRERPTYGTFLEATDFRPTVSPRPSYMKLASFVQQRISSSFWLPVRTIKSHWFFITWWSRTHWRVAQVYDIFCSWFFVVLVFFLFLF